MKKTILTIIILAVIVGGAYYLFGSQGNSTVSITSFQECIDAGNPVMESYPRKCRAGDQTFTENIGNALEKQDMIRVDNPRPNQAVSSPLTIEGEARGYWYFEAIFKTELLDGNGNSISTSRARAQSEWTTNEFVPFTSTMEFETPETATGTLVMHKQNASGLPENADQLVIPVKFE